jgi:hypothetical protein
MPRRAKSDPAVTTIEKALRFTRDTNDLAAMLSELTAKLSLIRVQHAMRVATLAS